MKMATISELRFTAADNLAFSSAETSRNLIYTAMHKLRMALVRMGLAKNHHEPIGQAVVIFDALRKVVQQRLDRDAQKINNYGLEQSDQIMKFWGFEGGKNSIGVFDNILNAFIRRSEGQPVADRIALLNSLRDHLESV